MKNPQKTEVKVFLTYKSLFSDVEKGGVKLPTSYLKDKANIEPIIQELIKDFNLTEAICYSSFLNAITQSTHARDIEKIGLNEIKQIQLMPHPPTSGIVFHRDNLLFVISKLISKNAGEEKITGGSNYHNARKYCKSLLLASELIPDASLEKDYFIRGYPYYYIPKTAAHIYELRIQRYSYIFNELLEEQEDQKKNLILEGLSKVENSSDLPINNYFRTIGTLYYWYLKIPINKEHFKSLGFDPQNIASFYINSKNFGENHDLIKLVDYLSLDLEGFKSQIKANKNRQDKIEGFYENIQIFFDHPVFKIDKGSYCIVDLKFLFDGLCSGLFWHIKSVSSSSLQALKEQYGYLMELYFLVLLRDIFGDENVEKPSDDGNADAILETDEYIIILEFTTEYYRLASLYQEQTNDLESDINRILFNSKGGKSSRGKSDDGKFLKLNRYLEKHKKSQKKIIPVLVTENYLGDFDLADRINGCVIKGIESHNLENLKTNKPIILNLDDLEQFWATAKEKGAINQFGKLIENWEELGENKGGYHFNFSFFVSEQGQSIATNEGFLNFFNFESFMEQ